MESFALSAQHSGAINHIHSLHFSQSAVELVREARILAAVLVFGWVAVTSIRAVKELFSGGN
jgi:hypothetical protein